MRSQGRTGPSCQPWATHDTSLTSMHISIEELAINLERAVSDLNTMSFLSD